MTPTRNRTGTSGGHGAGPVRRRSDLGRLVISWAARGGAGKTSIALALAQRAGERCPDLRVTLVDANRGQADVATYLRLGRREAIPGIHDAAVTGDPARAVLTRDAANALRPGRWFDELHFHLVPGPRNEAEADPAVVTADVYARVIEQAQHSSDLVIVDTQIVEAHDTGGLVDQLLLPLLRVPGVWGVANTDTSGVGIDNLTRRLRWMAADGVGREHMLLVVNRVLVDFSDDQVRRHFAPFVCAMERIEHAQSVVEMMNNGRVPADHRVYSPGLDRILHRITGRPEFAAPPGRGGHRRSRSRFGWPRRGERR